MNWIRTAVPLTLATLVGCGSDEDRVDLLPVVGNITMNGKPLADASVVFMPDNGNKISTPGGDATGPEGNFKLAWRNRAGVAAGKYTAVVTESVPKVSLPEGIDPIMAKAGMDAAKSTSKTKAAPIRNEFPVEVTEKETTFDFDVKKANAVAEKGK